MTNRSPPARTVCPSGSVSVHPAPEKDTETETPTPNPNAVKLSTHVSGHFGAEVCSDSRQSSSLGRRAEYSMSLSRALMSWEMSGESRKWAAVKTRNVNVDTFRAFPIVSARCLTEE
ncbi:hypothetical protein GCM10009691_34800 [Brevibacterium picturae]|uniref:Uncharacterized protein n=1 Tax=Brevibacterium picturae TaxID=260553 RepID=A0ABN2CFQ1_9MICO